MSKITFEKNIAVKISVDNARIHRFLETRPVSEALAFIKSALKSLSTTEIVRAREILTQRDMHLFEEMLGEIQDNITFIAQEVKDTGSCCDSSSDKTEGVRLTPLAPEDETLCNCIACVAPDNKTGTANWYR